MTLQEAQIAAYRREGHLTVAEVFAPERMDAAVADAMDWGEAFLAGMDAAARAWYLDRGAAAWLRKLDQPVAERPLFRELALDSKLLEMVAQIIGPPGMVFFSQIFFKPPGGGGPKPVHQDNFYFGPTDYEGAITAWIALDDATVENGCLAFVDGSNLEPLLPHAAPEGQPFNLQVDEALIGRSFTLAPVPKGGVSFHHGNTLHRSGDNRSERWRRAVAIHYAARGVTLTHPALEYDSSKYLAIG